MHGKPLKQKDFANCTVEDGSHLGYRSPQWIGEEFFAGMDALRLEAERTGKDATAVVYDSNMELIQSGDLDLVSCDLDEPAFVVGDCGPFICRDTEPGVNSERRKPDAQEWAPAEQGMWMALHCESNVCSLDGIRSQGAGTWNRRIRLASHRAFHAHVHFAPDASRQGTPRTRCGNR